jgi:hypothetical protein
MKSVEVAFLWPSVAEEAGSSERERPVDRFNYPLA